MLKEEIEARVKAKVAVLLGMRTTIDRLIDDTMGRGLDHSVNECLHTVLVALKAQLGRLLLELHDLQG